MLSKKKPYLFKTTSRNLSAASASAATRRMTFSRLCFLCGNDFETYSSRSLFCRACTSYADSTTYHLGNTTLRLVEDED
jgi:hypothetical protein